MSGLLSGMGSTLSASDEVVTESNDSATEFALTITPRAEQKASSMLIEKGHPDGFLRIYVVGGGRSGWQYGMAISDKIEADDVSIESNNGAKIIVDQESAPLLSGAEIDYVEDLMKSGFNIYNPNAVASCACGTSFQTSAGTGTPRPC